MKISNAKQFESLVEQLEKNPSLAKGFRRGAVPSNFRQQWEDIANKLNSFGPPRRDSDGWQKVSNRNTRNGGILTIRNAISGLERLEI